jgi:lipid-A-disaccharide synthase
MGGDYEFLLPIAPTLEPSFLKSLMGSRDIHPIPEALPSLYHSRAGIIASGTATVEAALMGTPFVMVYRVSPLTFALGRPRVKVPHFAMVNLIAEKEVVPELVQSKFTADNIVAELGKIIPDGEPRRTMLRELASVRTKLRKPDGNGLPAERAAEVILGMLG